MYKVDMYRNVPIIIDISTRYNVDYKNIADVLLENSIPYSIYSENDLTKKQIIDKIDGYLVMTSMTTGKGSVVTFALTFLNDYLNEKPNEHYITFEIPSKIVKNQCLAYVDMFIDSDESTTELVVYLNWINFDSLEAKSDIKRIVYSNSDK